MARPVDPVGSVTRQEIQPDTIHVDQLPDAALIRKTQETALKNITPFPHVAWAAVKAGLAAETRVNDKVNSHIKDIEKLQKEIDLLLDLSSELTAYKDGQPMPEKMQQLLADLKERGIDLWKSTGKTLTKEQASAIKSLISSQIDKHRSNTQIIFSTKIQPQIQAIGAIFEAIKTILQYYNRFVNATMRPPGH